MTNRIVWDDDADCHGFDFLPPVDMAIFDEILDGLESDQDQPSEPSLESDAEQTLPRPKSRPPKRRPRTRTSRTEIISLNETKAELEKALDDLEQKHTNRLKRLSGSELKWEQVARSQLELKLKALRENEQLRAAVAENHQLTQELEAIVLKKPRRMMMKMDDDQWRVLKLSAYGEKRLAAIHAIADRQLENMEGELVTTGLMGSSGNLFSVNHAITGPNRFYVEAMSCVRFQSSVAAVANAVWKAMAHVHVHASPVDSAQAHTFSIDQDTLYVRVAYHAPGGASKVESSVIFKKRPLSDRHVRLVFRTVLDDEAHPFDADSYVSDQYGWFDVEGDRDSVLLKSYAKSTSLHPHEHRAPETHERDVLRTLMESMSLETGQAFAKGSSPVKLAEDMLNVSFRKFGDLVEEFLQTPDGEDATERPRGHLMDELAT